MSSIFAAPDVVSINPRAFQKRGFNPSVSSKDCSMPIIFEVPPET